MRIFDVSWGLGHVRHLHVRAENAVDACCSVCQRFGWRRSSWTVDAATRGDRVCEMVVNRPYGVQTLLIAVSLDCE